MVHHVHTVNGVTGALCSPAAKPAAGDETLSGHWELLENLPPKVRICLICQKLKQKLDNPIPERVERELEKHHEEALATAGALQTMADGLPALGIVAAVMGVIKTMGSIDQPPEILGKMIGGALVGTFLGVFLSYGVVGPLAARIKAIHDEEARFYSLIRDVLVAYLNRHQPNICIEVGRKNVPGHMQPSFFEVEEALDAVKSGTAPAAAAA